MQNVLHYKAFENAWFIKYTITQLRASITENGGKMICVIIYKICNICDKCSFSLAMLRKKDQEFYFDCYLINIDLTFVYVLF